MRAVAAIGALLVMLSSLLLWIVAPIRGGGSDAVSFAWLGILVGAMAGVAWFSRSYILLTLSGVIGLGLCSFAVLHLTFTDAAFWSLVDENAQYAPIMRFSLRNLPRNLGLEPTFQPHLSTETVLNRLATASYFMGLGWWICFIGSLFVLVGGLKVGGKKAIRWATIVALLIFASQGVLLWHGFAAQYLLAQGDRSRARGHYAEAIQSYEAAQRLDSQLARSERTHLLVGEAYYQLKVPSHPSARLYLGHRLAQQGDSEAALAAYLTAAAEVTVPLKEILHKRIAWTYVDMGLARYQNGEIGPAAGQWERALAFDTAQLQAVYFLTRAYFEQGRYDQSIAMGRLLLSRSQNELLNANVQANIGDSYWKLNDFKSARTAFAASMRMDSFANFRIFKSLGGT